MATEFDFSAAADLPVQRDFLQSLVPVLAGLKETEKVWLAGSLARGDADRWSSVDILLALNARLAALDFGRQRARLEELLDLGLGREDYLVERVAELPHGGSLTGMTLAPLAGGIRRGREQVGGLIFSLHWAPLPRAALVLTGPLLPLAPIENDSGTRKSDPHAPPAQSGPPRSERVETLLNRFWLLLARLPAVGKRAEHLAAHALLTESRAALIDMVAALNGVARQQSRTRVNRFLGPAQQEAFEKTLGGGPSQEARSAPETRLWIGQAVAQVVLYRWYAPQLSQRYGAAYPFRAEETVLALLRQELEEWPAYVATS